MPAVVTPDRTQGRIVPGDVDLAQPLDTTHPLLRGVQGFWLPLPSTFGGSRLYDLSEFGRHAQFGGAWKNDYRLGNVQYYVNDDNFTNLNAPLFRTGSFAAFSTVIPNEVDATRYIHSTGVNDGWYYRVSPASEGANPSSEHRFLFKIDDGSNAEFGVSSTEAVAGKVYTLGIIVDREEDMLKGVVNGKLELSLDISSVGEAGASNNEHLLGARGTQDDEFVGLIREAAIFRRALSDSEAEQYYKQARRGFADLLRRRDESALYVSGGTSGITGTLSVTDAGELISAAGQTGVSGTLALTDSPETVTLSGATRIAGTASVTDGMEQVGMSGTVITEGSLSLTDSGELISMVSTLQDITGSVSITDSGEQIDATGQVKVAGTMQLADGSEEVVILGDTDIQGSLSVLDLAEQIAATGAVELQGSLSLTDAGETISARELVPERLATVDVRLEDIIIVNAQITD